MSAWLDVIRKSVLMTEHQIKDNNNKKIWNDGNTNS